MLSDDADWVARQKELLGNCSLVMDDDLSTEKKDIFMLTWWAPAPGGRLPETEIGGRGEGGCSG